MLAQPPQIHVFFHVARMGTFWREVVEYTTGAIDGSGLHNAATSLRCVSVGDNDFHLEHLSMDSPKWSVQDGGPVLGYEYPTLRALWHFAKRNPTAYVLYLHSKGVRDEEDQSRRFRAQWRRFMLANVVTRWRECVERLDEGYDSVGSWWQDGEYPHYSGNFFWVRGSFLNLLPEPKPLTSCGDRRIWAEFWLGSGYPKVYDLENNLSLEDVYAKLFCDPVGVLS